jgi:hypothetical protein
MSAAPLLRFRHEQTILEAGRGNALQACVASALGVADLARVPNFVEQPDYMAALNAFLEGYAPRLALVKVDLSKAAQPEEGNAPRLPLPTAAGTLCILVGKSPRGEHKHCVLARVAPDGSTLHIEHDPFPLGGGLRAPYAWAGFFALRLD